MHYHFTVYKEKDKYLAKCVELKGCLTKADDRVSLKENMYKSLNLYLSFYVIKGDGYDPDKKFPIPKHTNKEGVIEISVDVIPEIAKKLKFEDEGNRKTRSLNYLESIRKNRLCSYVGKTCDCKYGFEKVSSKGNTFDKFRHYGEQTGCPEMRDLMSLLNEIPDYVFLEAGDSLNEKYLENIIKFSNKCMFNKEKK